MTKDIQFFHYATCKCQAPEVWHIINRIAGELGITVRYVQTQTGDGQRRIREVFGENTIAHIPCIAHENKPLVLISGTDESAVRIAVAQALA